MFQRGRGANVKKGGGWAQNAMELGRYVVSVICVIVICNVFLVVVDYALSAISTVTDAIYNFAESISHAYFVCVVLVMIFTVIADSLSGRR